MNWLKNILLVVVSSLVALEGGSFLCVKLHLFTVNEDPVYSMNLRRGQRWLTEKEVWGVWHKPHAHDSNHLACVDTDYRSNNVGARDDIDYGPAMGGPNAVVLGDSFVEGFGIPVEETFAHGLKETYGKRGLNFGASGNIGPLQSYLMYRDLASRMPHDEVVYMFLPVNDFRENDFRAAAEFGPRYRPYFTPAPDGSFSIVYPPKARPSDDFPSDVRSHRRSILGTLQTLFVGYTYSANAVRSFSYYLAHRNAPRLEGDRQGYFTDDPVQVAGALHYIDELYALVPDGDRRDLIVIPSPWDVRNIVARGYGYRRLDWYKGLEALAARRHVRLIDLALDAEGRENPDYLQEMGKTWFLDCDPHWSGEGNRAVLERFVAEASRPEAIASPVQKP